MATIYRKTAEGQAEIETRARRLGPRLRSALIIVDGKRSDDELRKLIATQPDETLQALLEQALIEIAGVVQPKGAARAAASPAAASPPTGGGTGTRDFASRQRDAARSINDLLGPNGELLAIKLEQARDADELRPLLERAVTAITNMRGSAAAAQFAREFVEA